MHCVPFLMVQVIIHWKQHRNKIYQKWISQGIFFWLCFRCFSLMYGSIMLNDISIVLLLLHDWIRNFSYIPGYCRNIQLNSFDRKIKSSMDDFSFIPKSPQQHCVQIKKNPKWSNNLFHYPVVHKSLIVLKVLKLMIFILFVCVCV